MGDLSFTKRLFIFWGFCAFMLVAFYDTNYNPYAVQGGTCLICRTPWSWSSDDKIMSCEKCEWSVVNTTYFDDHLCPACGEQGKYEHYHVNCRSCDYHLPSRGYYGRDFFILIFGFVAFFVIFKREVQRGSW